VEESIVSAASYYEIHPQIFTYYEIAEQPSPRDKLLNYYSHFNPNFRRNPKKKFRENFYPKSIGA
jgi:hypothetical protein